MSCDVAPEQRHLRNAVTRELGSLVKVRGTRRLPAVRRLASPASMALRPWSGLRFGRSSRQKTAHEVMDSSIEERQRFVRRPNLDIVNLPKLNAVDPGAEVTFEQRAMFGFLDGHNEVSGLQV